MTARLVSEDERKGGGRGRTVKNQGEAAAMYERFARLEMYDRSWSNVML